ncbi:MAG: extracellular solute-binding protein [Oscillospiraceae bacterium]|nr:extracellular solute-binding protein [Oscillospiraceae bacterium]
MNIKKTILLVSAAILLLSLFLGSCQTGSEKDDDKNTGNPEQAETAGDQKEANIYPDLEAKDFGGYEFTFLSRLNSNWFTEEWDHRDLFSEKINGEIINDAIFNRNKKIEEKYNIKINEIAVQYDQFIPKVSQAVKAGDDIYDTLCTHLVSEIATLAQGGNIIDLFSMPVIDFAKPWWNQGGIKDLSIARKLFILPGDLFILGNDSMEAMIFNKSVLKENALENPYEIVKAGEWTFDKLIIMIKGVSKDLNGDGKMDPKDDMFGCLLQADTDLSFIVSGGEKICAKDENDYPVITFGSDKCYRITEAVSALMLDTDNVVNLHRLGELGYPTQIQMMEENRALFSWVRMRVVESLRGMEMDFGIIPLPKLDNTQEKYITHMNPYTGVGVSITPVASNLERTGMILEDLCAESKYTLQPAYYEINLRGKFVRDDDSYEMLDIILSNTAYDIGYIYDFGGFANTILFFGTNKKTEYASTFEKMEPKMQIDIDKTIEMYEKIN